MSKFFMSLFIGVFMLSLLFEIISRTNPKLAESLLNSFIKYSGLQDKKEEE